MKIHCITAAMLVLAVAVQAAAKDKAKPASTQKQAIAAIKKLGGSVTVDEKSPGKPVVGVALFGTQITDAWLVHLKGLTNLKSLILPPRSVTLVSCT